MGSGSSSQVKVIDNKTASMAALTSDPTALPGKKAAPSVVRPAAGPDNQHSSPSQKKRDAHTEVMALKPSSSTVQSLVDKPSTSKSASSVPPRSSNGPGCAKSNSAMSSASPGVEAKLTKLQRELNESESEKLDLHDRIQALEERLQEVMSLSPATTAVPSARADSQQSGEGTASHLDETLHAKDLYIQRLEKQMEAAETESKKVRVRLKKKIRALSTQLSETRQESSITRMELNETNASLQEQLRHSSQGNHSAMGARPMSDEGEDKDSRMKVILDLSAEVSEQSDQISALERTLREKDEQIEALKREASRAAAPPRTVHPVHSDTIMSGNLRGPIRSQPPGQQVAVLGISGRGGVPPVVETMRGQGGSRGVIRPVSKIGPRSSNPHAALPEDLVLQRQSTALSDSDSDWEMDASAAKIHSAPAGGRVKSAASLTAEKENPSASSSGGAGIPEPWSMATDDNDLTLTSEARPQPTSHGSNNAREKRRKSALKTKLERVRNERAKALMGPSLAFAAPPTDQLSDMSCEPTPRLTTLHELRSQVTTSDVMAFAM